MTPVAFLCAAAAASVLVVLPIAPAQAQSPAEPLVLTAYRVDGPSGPLSGAEPIWERAKPTADGGLVLVYSDSSAHVGPDGAYLGADTTAGLEVLPDLASDFDDRYRVSEAGVLYFTDAAGREDSVAKLRLPDILWQGEYLGATPQGLAIVNEVSVPYRSTYGPSRRFIFIDSTGRERAAYGGSDELSPPNYARLAAGFYFSLRSSRYANAHRFQTRVAGVLPWELIGENTSPTRATLAAPGLTVGVGPDGALRLAGIPVAATRLDVYGADGRLALSRALRQQASVTVERPGVLPKGAYALSLATADGRRYTRLLLW